MSRFTSVSELLDEFAPDLPAAAPAWEDVLARAELLAAATASNGGVALPRVGPRSRRHRQYVIAALMLVALVFAVVATAYALGHPIIDFGKAPKASSRTVVDDFGRLTIGVPTGIPVLPHQARRIAVVRVDGKKHVLWVAPVKHGGFCYEWVALIGTCRAHATGNAMTDFEAMGDYRRHALFVIGGSFFQSTAARIVLSYADGQTDEIPFVWVTAPINAGFYLFGIPDEHQQQGHQPVSVALLDSSNHVITSARVTGIEPPFPRFPASNYVRHQLSGYPPMMVPVQAQWSKRRQLFSWRTDNGIHVGLWIAPARGGGNCFWANQGSGCSSTTPQWPKIRRGRGYVTLCCTIARDVARVEVVFQDGDHVALSPKSGYLIWPIPQRHYRPGHRLDELVTYDAAGAELTTLSVPTEVRALYPCSKPKNYGYGLSMCP